MHRTADNPADLLKRCYAAAIGAVQPAAALHAPLRATQPAPGAPWIIGVGKASNGMARAIVGWLAELGRAPAGGIVVSSDVAAPPHDSITMLTGDHPIPGVRSFRAASAIASTIQRIPATDDVHVLLSGGASSLIAGPLPGLSTEDLTATFEALISSGLDIHAMNAVRKRLTRWSAGRLALHLHPRPVHVWVISDVPGDDLGSIASGPCTGDSWSSADVREALGRQRMFSALPVPVQEALGQETPKPSDPWLAAIMPQIVATNSMALLAAAAAARAAGVHPQIMLDPLAGDAAEMGQKVAATAQRDGNGAALKIWGGETTVTIPHGGGLGGRSQELALAAAQRIVDGSTTLLAAGTDGRDGPTDAAGALVDGKSWAKMIAAARDPSADLREHNAYRALDAADALLRTGPTGTNVMDLVMTITEMR